MIVLLQFVEFDVVYYGVGTIHHFSDLWFDIFSKLDLPVASNNFSILSLSWHIPLLKAVVLLTMML